MTVRFVNHRGRAALDVGGRAVDLADASGGKLPADPMDAIGRWDQVVEWARAERDAIADRAGQGDSFAIEDLGPCVPRPAKVFGVALNYRRHAEETGAELPPAPSVFTKFPSCIAGPAAPVALPSATVDWEVELVVVIGRGGRDIAEEDARAHVAGYCVGQDYSDRVLQMSGARPQFSLGKSYDSFGPIGPAIVSLDAFADPDDLPIWCEVDGERVQDSTTADLIFPVPYLVSYLSSICTLTPGDLVFTGTPSGVGVARTPPRFLREGNVVVSGIDGVGTIRNVAVPRAAPPVTPPAPSRRTTA